MPKKRPPGPKQNKKQTWKLTPMWQACQGNKKWKGLTGEPTGRQK